MDEEKRKLALTLLDEMDTLRTIHELRWQVLELKDKRKDIKLYVIANELLNDIEREIWNKILIGE